MSGTGCRRGADPRACGAALWVAALLTGTNEANRAVATVVHVGGDAARVTEFENTPSAMLSVEEFDVRARLREGAGGTRGERRRLLGAPGGITALTCIHKDHDGSTHFAHGMCRQCYLEAHARVSGGARGGDRPRSRRRRRGATGRRSGPTRAAGDAALPAPAAKRKKMSAKAREAMEAIEREARAEGGGGDRRKGQGRRG